MPEPVVASIDPDVDLNVSAQPGELRPNSWPVLGAVSAGGVVGALARYGLQETFPHEPGQFGWASFGINLSGCLLIGVLMVVVDQVWTARRLLRPFLGVGMLGGFTTFSTYAVDIQQAVSAGAVRTALFYLGGTLVGALIAVWAGAALTGWAIRSRHIGRSGQVPR